MLIWDSSPPGSLLEDDEARLATFEDARLRVEKKEQKDMARAVSVLIQ